MRVRDKRKQQKEQNQKSHKLLPKPSSTSVSLPSDKQKLREATTPTPPSPPPPPQSQRSQQTSPVPPVALPAIEKVAFDNRIKRKNVLALNEKVAALREYDRQPIYKHVGRIFNCSPDQIKRIVQQRDEILQAWDQRTRRSQDARTMEMKVVRVSMLGRAVYDWIRRMMYYKDFIITDGLLQKMALEFRSSMGLNSFFPHSDWCDKFRQTYNIEHSDTKQLKIGYTQGQSVQIKDIVRAVMHECTPEVSTSHGNGSNDDTENISLDGGTTNSSHAGEDEEDDVDVDIDGGGQDEDDDDEDIKPQLSELNPPRVPVPSLPQLVGLPIQAPGSSQKVLLATPIVPAGSPAAAGGRPMTMTIIPLATLTQSITQRPSPQPQETAAAATALGQATTKPPAAVPPPIIDIKKEIKTEPNDPDEQPPEPEKCVDPTPTAVQIKQEFESDAEADVIDDDDEDGMDDDNVGVGDGDDDDDDDDANGGRSSVMSLAEVLAANVEDEKEYIEKARAMRGKKRLFTEEVELQATLAKLPPLPVLTKAPMAKFPPKRSRQPDDNNNAASTIAPDSGTGTGTGTATDNGTESHRPPISCGEARKCLKLLEEFALHKENYRLIELMTRADEVMRELSDDSTN